MVNINDTDLLYITIVCLFPDIKCATTYKVILYWDSIVAMCKQKMVDD